MEVVIAGAGSIGMLIGSFLAEAGANVMFYVRSREQANALNQQGLARINPDGTTKVFYLKAATYFSQLPEDAIWIIGTKYAGVPSILSAMEKAQVTGPLLFIQNGIAHMELAYATKNESIAFATVEHGAKRLDDRTVSHNGVGPLTIAPGRGDQEPFRSLGAVDSVAFPVVFHENAEQILMRKVLINCMINPLTALLQVRNGELVENPYAQSLFQQLYDELMDAFPEYQNMLPYESAAAVCIHTASNQSSMLSDYLAGRPMEIETIVSAMIRKADLRKASLPVLKTLEQMLRVIDKRGAGQ